LSNPVENREPASPVGEGNPENITPLQGEVNSGGEFQCMVCGQIFTNQADLNEHMLSHERSQERAKKEEKPAGAA
jgi:Zinc finger, C2H2 type